MSVRNFVLPGAGWIRRNEDVGSNDENDLATIAVLHNRRDRWCAVRSDDAAARCEFVAFHGPVGPLSAAWAGAIWESLPKPRQPLIRVAYATVYSRPRWLRPGVKRFWDGVGRVRRIEDCY